jgi:hypothetical protein
MAGPIYGRAGEEFNEYQYQTHDLGQKMIIGTREFRYAQMGVTLGVAGSLYQSEVPTSTWMTMAANAAQAVGTRTISATLGSTNATIEDEFNQGYASIENNAGEGHIYPFARAFAKGDTNAKASAAATQSVNLAPGYSIRVALTTSTTLSFFKNEYDEVIIHPSIATALVVGLATKAVTASYYCWLQTRGIASVLAEGTLVINEPVRPSETDDGAVAALDYDESSVGSKQYIGMCVDIGADTEHSTVYLQID